MGRKETEEAIADSRAGRVSGRFGSVAELLADLNVDDTPDIHHGSINVYADPGYDPAEALTTATFKIRPSSQIGVSVFNRRFVSIYIRR